MDPLLLFVGCLVCSFVSVSQCQTLIVTIPETTDAQPVAYVAADKGEINVFLQCFVFASPDSPVITEWRIQRYSVDANIANLLFNSNDGSVSSPSDLADDLIVTGELAISDTAITYRTNFTILNFTDEFDTTKLECGVGSDRKTFTLGFPGNTPRSDD